MENDSFIKRFSSRRHRLDRLPIPVTEGILGGAGLLGARVSEDIPPGGSLSMISMTSPPVRVPWQRTDSGGIQSRRAPTVRCGV